MLRRPRGAVQITSRGWSVTADDRPRVALITGEPGSGKSDLGANLSRALRAPFIARDDVRGGLFLTAGAWSARSRRVPTADEATDAFLRIVESTVALGVSCIVEYLVRRGRPADLRRLATVADCRVLHTWCRDGPGRLVRRNTSDRLLNRRPVLDALGYTSIDEHTSDAIARMRSVSNDMQTDFDLPVLKVNTDDGYEPGLDLVIDFVVDGAPDGTVTRARG
jgi:predicted kinase